MPRLTVTGTNIDAPDANALADFYRRLLGWTTRTEEPGWVVLQPGDGAGTLSFRASILPVPGTDEFGRFTALRGDLSRGNPYS